MNNLHNRLLWHTIDATTHSATKSKPVTPTMFGVLLYVAVAIVLLLWADRAFV